LPEIFGKFFGHDQQDGGKSVSKRDFPGYVFSAHRFLKQTYVAYAAPGMVNVVSRWG